MVVPPGHDAPATDERRARRGATIAFVFMFYERKIMSDDLKARGIDRTRVSLAQDWEVAYWTKHFDVTRERLGEAKQAVGSSADAVARYLQTDKARH